MRFFPPMAALHVTLHVLLITATQTRAESPSGPPFRMMTSLSTMADVNENDVRAALKVWANAVERQLGMGIDDGRAILATTGQLVQAVREGRVDGFAATVLEYLQVAEYVDPALIVLDEVYATGGEAYLILVHEESGMRSFRDLGGRSLVIYSNGTMCLASAWLQTLLAETNSSKIEGFFGAVTENPKLSKGVVLPVFFRQIDACLVTRRAFETMCELNPQLRKRLRVIETSPKLVPVVMVFHKDSAPDRKKRFAQAILTLHETPVGQQLLALFQGRRLLLRDSSSLAATIELVSAAERLKAPAARRAR
jgi:ABC-type phosphate/phosphonate transport system substrate-binding protein